MQIPQGSFALWVCLRLGQLILGQSDLGFARFGLFGRGRLRLCRVFRRFFPLQREAQHHFKQIAVH